MGKIYILQTLVATGAYMPMLVLTITMVVETIQQLVVVVVVAAAAAAAAAAIAFSLL